MDMLNSQSANKDSNSYGVLSQETRHANHKIKVRKGISSSESGRILRIWSTDPSTTGTQNPYFCSCFHAAKTGDSTKCPCFINPKRLQPKPSKQPQPNKQPVIVHNPLSHIAAEKSCRSLQTQGTLPVSPLVPEAPVSSLSQRFSPSAFKLPSKRKVQSLMTRRNESQQQTFASWAGLNAFKNDAIRNVRQDAIDSDEDDGVIDDNSNADNGLFGIKDEDWKREMHDFVELVVKGFQFERNLR